MSFRIGSLAVICDEPDGKCELCGKVADIRPYGPRGENICFECGEKNPAARDRQLRRILLGEDVQ